MAFFGCLLSLVFLHAIAAETTPFDKNDVRKENLKIIK